MRQGASSVCPGPGVGPGLFVGALALGHRQGGGRHYLADDVPHEPHGIFAAVKFDHLLGIDDHYLTTDQPHGINEYLPCHVLVGRKNALSWPNL